MDSLKQISVSIIIPCYNQAQYLADALDSVLAQTCVLWECIIVNDGSIDNTEEIAQDYLKKDTRFKYIYKPNGGLSSARNAGIYQSTGSYILPLDADDKIGPLYIEKALAIFNQTPAITLVYSQARYFGLVNDIWHLRPYSYKELLKSNMIFCSALLKRDDVVKIGGYDEQLKTGYEDWDLYIRLLNTENKIVQLNDFHFFYRVKSVSMLKDIDETLQHELNNYVYNKHQLIYNTIFGNSIDNIRLIDLYENMYKNSPDYKLGNLLIRPFRNILNKLKKSGK